MMNTTDKQLESNNLKVIKDQLGYEALLNKKFNEYGSKVIDQNLKNLCNESSLTHKQNFNTLKTYLDSHQ